MKILITRLDIQREEVNLTSHISPPVPDPTWWCRDSNGEVHRWHRLRGHDKDSASAWALPTLTKRTKQTVQLSECPECGHEKETTEYEEWWETPDGERVEPGFRDADLSQKFGKGPMSWGGTAEIELAMDEAMPTEFQMEDAQLVPDIEAVLIGRAVVTTSAHGLPWHYTAQFTGSGPLGMRGADGPTLTVSPMSRGFSGPKSTDSGRR